VSLMAPPPETLHIETPFARPCRRG